MASEKKYFPNRKRKGKLRGVAIEGDAEAAEETAETNLLGNSTT